MIQWFGQSCPFLNTVAFQVCRHVPITTSFNFAKHCTKYFAWLITNVTNCYNLLHSCFANRLRDASKEGQGSKICKVTLWMTIDCFTLIVIRCTHNLFVSYSIVPSLTRNVKMFCPTARHFLHFLSE